MIVERLTGKTQTEALMAENLYSTLINTVSIPSVNIVNLQPVQNFYERDVGDTGFALTSDRQYAKNPDNPTPIPAYYLPWSADTGLYLDLPNKEPLCTLFLTATLTGCYFGIQDIKSPQTTPPLDITRVRHWNMQDMDLSEEDLLRFGSDIKWLIPQWKTPKSISGAAEYQ